MRSNNNSYTPCMCVPRIVLAVMHYNENANRLQLETRAGVHRYSIQYKKWKKVGYTVRKMKEKATHGMKHLTLDTRNNLPYFISFKSQLSDSQAVGDIWPHTFFVVECPCLPTLYNFPELSLVDWNQSKWSWVVMCAIIIDDILFWFQKVIKSHHIEKRKFGLLIWKNSDFSIHGHFTTTSYYNTNLPESKKLPVYTIFILLPPQVCY